ncbi:MAG: hypothetical protein AB7G75_20815 [Candidatus Binatia bacterium]
MVWIRSCCWAKIFLLLFLIVSACSTQQKPAHDNFLDDPFDDPFFTNAPAWDSSVLQQSEILTQDEGGEPDEPRSLLERSGDMLMGALIVGGGLARLAAMPLLGF